MKIRKQKRDGIWYLDLRSEGGGQISLGTRDKKYAEKIFTQLEAQRLQGKFNVKLYTAGANVALKKASADFLEYLAMRRRAKTVERYAVSSRALLSFFGGGKTVKNITRADIQQYQVQRLNDGVSPTTINRDLQFLRNLCNHLIDRDLLSKNPVAGKMMLSEDNQRVRVLTDREIKTLLKVCEDPFYLYVFVSIALHTGMRRGEIMSLHLPDRDLAEYAQHAAKNEINWINRYDWVFVLNRTKHGRRQVPVNYYLKHLLEQYLQGCSPGSLWPVKYVRWDFDRARTKAKLKDFIFHDLRRTFISRMAERGFSREMVQEICGQVSESVFRRYFHPSDEAKKNLVEEYASIMQARQSKTGIRKMD